MGHGIALEFAAAGYTVRIHNRSRGLMQSASEPGAQRGRSARRGGAAAGGRTQLYQQIGQLKPRYPLGRLGEPDDIGYGALFLASDASSFITGAQLVIGGGYTAQ